MERSTMVVVDHFCYQLWKITPVPWGTFRTPHLERLKAGNAIMSMMFESTAIILCELSVIIYSIYLLIRRFLLKLANEVCHLDLSSTGDWVVFHKCVSCYWNTLSECASYGCLAKTLEEKCLSGIVNAIPVALWSSGNQLDAVYYQFSKDLPPI